MNWILSQPILAQSVTTITDPRTQWDWPRDPFDVTLLVALGVLAVSTVFVYLRDTAGLGAFWRVWLPVTRLGVIATLVVILLNPHQRTTEESVSPSRVVVLVDVSPSMDLANRLPDTGDSPGDKGPVQSRTEVARQLLADTDLIEKLREKHEVLVYTFGERLYDRIATYPRFSDEESAEEDTTDEETASENTANAEGEETEPADESAEDAAKKDDVEIAWDEQLEPRGVETRLGDALRDLVREYASDTFSGIVVVTDGANNAGNDAEVAKGLGRKQNVRFVTVGLGSTRRLSNLRVTNVQVAEQVQANDPYVIKAYVQGQNLKERRVAVELLAKPAADRDAPLQTVAVDEGDNPVVLDLPEDGREVEIPFRKTSTVAGEIEYVVRVTPERATPEIRDDDNERSQVVEVRDKPTGVLIVAGGPMRDYRFVRNMLTRHEGVDLWVWLQTVEPGKAEFVSQESNHDLLTSFPSKAELYENIDVVVAFDPDWTRLSEEERAFLSEWNAREGGGLVLVAGDVHTPVLVREGKEFDVIRDLYPVVLENLLLLDVGFSDDDVQPWEPAFSREAENVEFLQLADDPIASKKAWDEFEGFYRCYPTVGTKGGTTVYAHFSNPRARSAAGSHILLAGHTPGLGKVLYLGSSEIWRLRGVGEKQFDNFWTKSIREASKGRMQRGGSRVLPDAERDEYYLGETVVIRARVLDSNFDPVEVSEIEMNVVDPAGRPVVPSPKMRPVPKSPGQYRGSFRANVASQKSRYSVTLNVPGIDEKVKPVEVKVTVPNRELDEPQQNARLLEELGKEGDRNFYVSLEGRSGEEGVVEAAAEAIPTYLVNRTKPVVLDERRNKLWDRAWVLYLLVALLSVEWLTRKLLKLA